MIALGLLMAAVATVENHDCKYDVVTWARSGLEAPCRVLTGATLAARTAAVKAAWKLSDASADCVARTWNGERLQLVPLADCVEAEPESFALWAALAFSNHPIHL